MFQLSTDGILQYEAHRLCYVFSNVPINQLYDRYNAAQDGKYCENVGVEHSIFSNSLPLALRRQGFGGHPSHAPLHSAYFCKQKKSTDSKPCGLPSVALAKDGGGKKGISNNSLTHKQAKVFQV